MNATWLKLSLLLCLLLTAGPSIAGGAQKTWDFEVLLDGSPIGYHRFQLSRDGDSRRLESEARFDVRFLFFTAFRYRHTNTEVWDDGCLRSIESSTDSNGKDQIVVGARLEDGFVVQSENDRTAIDGCVMTFAYWNPDFLEQPRLLNPQTGEYLPVEVEPLGRRTLVVRGEEIDANAYRLRARQMELTVWYSDSDEWLGLESVAQGGRIIRYELT